MTNLDARRADGGWFGSLQQHGYVPKVLRTHGLAVSEYMECDGGRANEGGSDIYSRIFICVVNAD